LEDAVKDPWFLKDIELVKMDINDSKEIINQMGSYKQTNMFTKAIRLCMSKIYENSNFDMLKEKFFEFDDNKNGILERDEFMKFMKTFDFSEQEIDIMISALDLNNDGQIAFSEFIAGCATFDSTNL